MTKQNQSIVSSAIYPAAALGVSSKPSKSRTYLKKATKTCIRPFVICQIFPELALFYCIASLRTPLTENTKQLTVPGSSLACESPQNKSPKWSTGRGRQPHLLHQTALQGWAECTQSSLIWWRIARGLLYPEDIHFFLLLQDQKTCLETSKQVLWAHVSARWHKRHNQTSTHNYSKMKWPDKCSNRGRKLVWELLWMFYWISHRKWCCTVFPCIGMSPS